MPRARELLARLEALPRPAFYYRAMVHGALCDTDRAFSLLDQAIGARESLLPQLASLPAFTPLSGDPRFERALRLVGLRS